MATRTATATEAEQAAQRTGDTLEQAREAEAQAQQRIENVRAALTALETALGDGNASVTQEGYTAARFAVEFAEKQYAALHRRVEQLAQEYQAAQAAVLAEQLAALDVKRIEALRATAAAALDDLGAAIKSFNDQAAALVDEARNISGSDAPYVNGAYQIGTVAIERQRLQTTISALAKDVVRRYNGRGEISLDSPRD